MTDEEIEALVKQMTGQIGGATKSTTNQNVRKGPVTINGRSYWINARYVDDKGTITIDGIEEVEPATGQSAQEVKAKADADKAVLDLTIAQWAYDNDIPQLKTEYDLAEQHAKITKMQTENRFLPQTIQASLDQAAQSIKESQSRTAIAEAKAPGERAETGARTGLLGAQATGTQIDNAIKVLGGLATYEERRNAVRAGLQNGTFDEATADAIMDRLKNELTTGVPAADRFTQEQATVRQTQAEGATLVAQRERETAATQRQTQTSATTAATSVTGDEAARQRQILQSTVAQQGNQANAVNSFLANYQQGNSPTATGGGFLDGLAMVRDIFTSIKDIAQPAPSVGQAEGFIGNLLASGAGQPAMPTPAAAAPVPGLDDPLVAAAAAEDSETEIPPADWAAIQPLIETNPIQAMNMTVESWKRSVRRPSTINKQPAALVEVL